jgi:hypothetical protein
VASTPLPERRTRDLRRMSPTNLLVMAVPPARARGQLRGIGLRTRRVDSAIRSAFASVIEGDCSPARRL